MDYGKVYILKSIHYTMKKQTKTITTFTKECPECKKEIVGYSESQVEYNLDIHIKAKHKDKKWEVE